MAYVYQIVVLDPRTTLLIKCRAIYMATLTGSRNMHHWTFTLNLNFATGMWKQTFHDDLECHKLVWKNQCPTCSEHPCSDVERTWSGTSQKGTGVLKMKGVSQKLQFLRSVCRSILFRTMSFTRQHDWAYRDYFRSCAQRSLHHCKKREAHLWQVWPVLVSSEV